MSILDDMQDKKDDAQQGMKDKKQDAQDQMEEMRQKRDANTDQQDESL